MAAIGSAHLTITASVRPLKKAIGRARKAIKVFAKKYGLTKRQAARLLQVHVRGSDALEA